MHRALAIPEILEHILGFIDDDADRMSCMFVCLFWLGVAHNLRWRVNMLALPQRYMQSEQMSRVLAHAPTDIMWATTTVTAGNALFFTRGPAHDVLSLVCGAGLSLDVVKWLVAYFGLSLANNSDQCMLFRTACGSGNLEIAKWMSAYSRGKPCDHLVGTLTYVCSRGCLAVLQWLRKSFPIEIDKFAMRDMFENACFSGNLELIQSLVNEFELSVDYMRAADNSAFASVCSLGHLPAAQWFLTRLQITADDVARSCAFPMACCAPQMNIIRWLADQFEFTPSHNDWFNICQRARLDDVVWFVDRYLHTVNYGGLARNLARGASANKDSRVLAWLVDRFQMTADDVRLSAFISNVCILANFKWIVTHFGYDVDTVYAGGHFTLDDSTQKLMWLSDHFHLTLDDLHARNITLYRVFLTGSWQRTVWFCERFGLTADNARSDAIAAFRAACTTEDPKCAKWLAERFELTADVARADNNGALRAACAHGHLATVQWLVAHFGLTVDDVRASENAVCEALARGHLAVVQWLCERFELVADDIPFPYVYRLAAQMSISLSKYKSYMPIMRWVLSRFRLSFTCCGADTLLWCACKYKDWEFASWLIERVKFPIDDAAVTLRIACSLGDREAIAWLVRHFEFTEAHKRPVPRQLNQGLARVLAKKAPA